MRAFSIERRKFPRIPTEFGIKMIAQDAIWETSLQNISREGFQISIPKRINPALGSEIKLKLRSSLGFTRTIGATIVYKSKAKAGLKSHEEIDPQELIPRSPQFQEMLNQAPGYEASVPKAMVFSGLVYEFAKRYCNLQVEGIENIPYGSRFLWTHNHSGWIALDAVLIGHLIAAYNKHDQLDWSFERMGLFSLMKRFSINEPPGDWGVTFWNRVLIKVPIASEVIRSMHGLSVARVADEVSSLKGYRIFATPAEGEEGSTKSSFFELYQLQRFRSGIGKLAIELDLDFVIPVVILGPEETFLNFGKFKLLKNILGTTLPMPLMNPPIPVEWKMIFLPALDLKPYKRTFAAKKDPGERRMVYYEIMSRLNDVIKERIKEELKTRKKYLPWFLKEPR